MINCIKELVLDGKNVKLNDLAIFSVGLKSAGAANLEDFSVNEHIKGVRLRARATGELSSSALKAEAVMKQLTQYSTTTESTAEE